MNRDDICEAFIDSLPFDPYPFQEEAILGWYDAPGGVLVSAPTGMGKTLIAEAAVFEALKSGQTLYYTTPLIALSDQKFSELQDRAEQWGFPRDEVGLLTGNRKVNPNATVLVVVAEILLNHLLSPDHVFEGVCGVVMDEFHYFNDLERGVVWELALVLLPPDVRLLLLSATVGNAAEFVVWLRDKHDRHVQLVTTTDRRVPLQFHWIEDRLITDQLVRMTGDAEEEPVRTPALVFCFSRDECWDMAQRLRGLPLIPKAQRADIEAVMARHDLTQGIGPRLQQMLIRGVGVHHAGVLPRHKAVVEELFLERLIPFVVCTETLAAGVNLPARSVVLASILKGKPGSRKLLHASAGHQMFGRAGRPQFDTEGHVYALAHEDDVKIYKWKQKYEQIPAQTKDPALIRARKQLEKKRPSRRKTMQYWSEGQFKQLVAASPADLQSRAMIPYRFVLYLLEQGSTVPKIREFLRQRFNSADRLTKFENQLDGMIANLVALGHIVRDGDEEDVDAPLTLTDSVADLQYFKSVDPLYGAFLAELLASASRDEKLLALESVLQLPWPIVRACQVPYEREKGPLQSEFLEPLLISMGHVVAKPEPTAEELERKRLYDTWDDDEDDEPPTFPEMLKIAYEARLAEPEDPFVQTKWVAGALFEADGEFFRFVGARKLGRNEGLVMRHVLRLVLLADEFYGQTEDPDYEWIANAAEGVGVAVDAAYTERFLAASALRADKS